MRPGEVDGNTPFHDPENAAAATTTKGASTSTPNTRANAIQVTTLPGLVQSDTAIS